MEDPLPIGRFSNEMHRLPEQRRQLIFRIRRQLAEGVYDTPQRLELALDRMLDRIDSSGSVDPELQ